MEKEHRPVILALTSPYSDEFLQSSEHLPLPLQTLFQVKYLSFNYFELLKMSIQYQITSISLEHQQRLASYTRGLSTNKQWYKYRAGRVTASTIYQVIRTDPHRPSVSMIKQICYPEITVKPKSLSNEHGCKHEKTEKNI